jgi:excisionase family DNA binding protein
MRDTAGPDVRRLTEPGDAAGVMRDVRPLTVKEAAERARVSVKTIRRAYSDGHLPFYRPAGRRSS